MRWRDDDQRRVTEMRRRRVAALQQRLDQYRTDPHRIQREQLRECPVCFYVDVVVAGQAFTAYTCQRCGKNGMHHDTHVPLLCSECADAIHACVQCGGDRQLSIG